MSLRESNHKIFEKLFLITRNSGNRNEGLIPFQTENEHFYEGGLEKMNHSVRDTAENGGYSRGARVIGDDVRVERKKRLQHSCLLTDMNMEYRIVLLPGDGVGPEVSESVRRVLNGIGAAHSFSCQFHEHLVGGKAYDETGLPLPDDTLEACFKADAVFLGAVGGPKWDDLPSVKRPEAGLLRLRKELGVYCNLRPIVVDPSMALDSPLKSDRVAGTDLLIVRELTGGLYFGEPRSLDDDFAVNTLRYTTEEISRIARIAFDYARKRRGSVTSVDKANVLEVSVLWRRVVSDIHQAEYADVDLKHMYVDNAAMQLVLEPRQFDVVLTGNLFGDILSDLGATLPGSVGMLPSASIGGRVGLFEPVHGSAPDLAGKGVVNPVAAILSAAMMLDDLGETAAAEQIRNGVNRAWADGYRTADMFSDKSGPDSSGEPGEATRVSVVGTQEMTDAILSQIGMYHIGLSRN